MRMEARFVAAASALDRLPPPGPPEVAVAGRSNCGKSTLVNAIAGRARLARVSATPGRTQELVFFSLTLDGGERLQLVDLPGYGYARASREAQRRWSQLVTAYIDSRPTLRALLVLLDARRAPEQEERDLLRWAALRSLAVHVVLTKADKLRRSERIPARERARAALALDRDPLLHAIDDADAAAALRAELASLVERDQASSSIPAGS
jgi:GTP-binding protein